MSQEKVDRYKEEKSHRKQNLKKAKAKSIAGRICAVAIADFIIVWGCYYIYTRHEENKPTNYIEIDPTAINDYQNSLTGN